MNTVIHVYLIFKKKNYYFGSIAAIYEYLTAEDVGISQSYLAHKLSHSGSLLTKKAMIWKGTIRRKKNAK